MTKHIIAAIAATTLSSSALAGMVECKELENVDEPNAETQKTIFETGVVDRPTAVQIDAGQLVCLSLATTADTTTECRGPSQVIVHVPGYAKPRCLKSFHSMDDSM